MCPERTDTRCRVTLRDESGEVNFHRPGNAFASGGAELSPRHVDYVFNVRQSVHAGPVEQIAGDDFNSGRD